MLIQISSGMGPIECEIAVKLLFESLKREFTDIKPVTENASRFSDGYTSVVFSTDEDLFFLAGSVLWICKSPARPNHRRKNWYIGVNIIPEKPETVMEGEIRIDSFRSGGKGGQSVNKVETGVRLTHIPTGIIVTSTSERSQYLNKKDAHAKLQALLWENEKTEMQKQQKSAWKEHNSIERGNPMRVYEGMDFKLIKCMRGK